MYRLHPCEEAQRGQPRLAALGDSVPVRAAVDDAPIMRQ
jgi:hypothetical protein